MKSTSCDQISNSYSLSTIGDCGINPKFFANAFEGYLCMSLLFKYTAPFEGRTNLHNVFNKVDFPHPFEPIIH